MRVTRGLWHLTSLLSGLRETAGFCASNSLDPTTKVGDRVSLGRRQAGGEFGTLSTAFKAATWIWTADGVAPLFAAEPGERFFRVTYTPPTGKTAVLAEVLIAADNQFNLFVNGALVGDGDSFHDAQGYRIGLYPGPILFAVKAWNENATIAVTGGGRGAAGLLAAIRITHSDGTQVIIDSDASWRANILLVPGFQLPTMDDLTWVPATVVAQYGTSDNPWGSSVALPATLAAIIIPPPITSGLPRTATSTAITTTSSSALTPSTPTSTPGNSNNKAAYIGGIIGGFLFFLLSLLLLLLCWRRWHQKNAKLELEKHAAVPFIGTMHMEQDGAKGKNQRVYGQPQAPHLYPPSSSQASSASPAPQVEYHQPPPYTGNDGGYVSYNGPSGHGGME